MTTTPSASGIQIGLVTHHHDQSMLPVNFNTRNTRNNTVPNPIPFDVLLFAIMLLLILLLLVLMPVVKLLMLNL